ncbi:MULTISPECIES: heavy metal translocating P-type ATPase [Enterococcus]|uniref:heavy metal translocating P-type ATPase n=1 Tax=Enterococcus TaxID=1350 RepID=UPI000A334E98|nr:heavy metal translocating P-type ATPase [Enterococcus sp. 2G9_DIV0600]MBO0427285.1 cadmium-translocating P-type ATPase [Enterococcus faecium]OTO31687.1 cadmium-translocating P-type ATPase [Enterococcus sp. 2G9_DIV0600]
MDKEEINNKNHSLKNKTSNHGGTEHKHNEEHDHSHGNIPVYFYFIGLITFLIALFLGEDLLILSNMLFSITVVSAGYHVIIEGFGDTIKDSLRTKKFMPNIHFLMVLAAAAAMIIGSFEEAGLLILIFAGAHFLEDYAEGKSKREITNLLKLNPTEARRISTDNSVEVVSVDQLVVGDKVQVLNGGQVPTDGKIISGTTSIDESSINGESIPKEKTVGDDVFGSTINGTGSFVMEVSKDSSDTVFAKILKLVDQSQKNLSKTATTIKRLEPKYVTLVLMIFPFILVLGPTVFGWSWNVTLYRSIVFLISSSPCALAASAVPATLSAISNLAKRGVLFKGGSFLSNLGELKAICFDKTGTLTKGKPVVTNQYFIDGVDEEEVIDVIVSMEKESNHPLATAIVSNFPHTETKTLSVENEVGRGLVSTFNDNEYRISKPSEFNSYDKNIKEKVNEYSKDGKTVVLIAINKEVIGLIALMDVPNSNAKDAIEYFNDQGVHTTLITGDAKLTGESIGNELKIGQVIANVLPEDKAKIIKQQQDSYGLTAMVGDGVNDAPALVNADVGIAMGDGTDVAIDVADVVLMKNDISNLVYAHKVSRRLNKIVWQNIIFSMFIVLLLISLNFLGKMTIGIGVLAHEGSTVLVIFNGLRLLIPQKEM